MAEYSGELEHANNVCTTNCGKRCNGHYYPWLICLHTNHSD
uniref:Uncharacterized protein n=1 Tax=Anguilla anguilla TaxID=7936 RepID=A0A0E9PHZ8_ANGAN